MIKVLKQALEALEFLDIYYISLPQKCMDANISLRQAIANLEQEKEIHDRHCNQGEWKGVCKYSDPNCPTIAELESQEAVATVKSETGNPDVMMSWWHEPALAVGTKLYTHQPQRTWVGLDHHDKKKFSSWLDHKSDDEVFTAIEAKLKELNT